MTSSILQVLSTRMCLETISLTKFASSKLRKIVYLGQEYEIVYGSTYFVHCLLATAARISESTAGIFIYNNPKSKHITFFAAVTNKKDANLIH